MTEDEEVFDGPDLSDPEVRAAVGFMTGIFKIPLMDPDIPDVWVENVRDALFSSGMAAIYRAADCRVKAEVPVRLRNEAGAIPRWKHAYAWSAVRRSLNSMPDLFKRTGRLKFADIEGMVRCVLDVFQKRSQGVEIRLRDEVSAANLADYPSLASYIADMELRYSKLAGHGVTMTDGEQRYHLLKGLTSNYESIKASIVSHRDCYGNRADFAMAVTLLEDYEDNTLAVANPSRTTGNREVTMASFGSKTTTGGEKDGASCFFFARNGYCRKATSCRFRHVSRVPPPHQQPNRRTPVEDYSSSNQRGRGGSSKRQKKGDKCRNCGGDGHWARECRKPKQDRANVAVGEEWSRSTREFVGHGQGFKMPYQQEKWLVDSASTCLVANEHFKEFFNVGPAAVTITVGGDHRLQCTKVGDLSITTSDGPLTLQEVRIVPGFGVNILSGPYLEKKMGLSLSSDGHTWWAKRRGRQVLKGVADSTGLYWVTLTRLVHHQWPEGNHGNTSGGSTSNNVPMGSIAPQGGNNDGGSKGNPSVSPTSHGMSTPNCSNLTLFPHLSRNADGTDSQSQSSQESSEDERVVDHRQVGAKRYNGADVVCLTRLQTSDLLAAHLRWGHRSFRRCAYILGVPAPVKAPFCEACVEAKASRHPRGPRGVKTDMVREPATRPGFRLYFDPIGPFREATLHRYRYALVVLDDFSGLLQAKFMVRLTEWFSHLSGLVKRIEAEKGSERVVAQIGSDSFPAFVDGHAIADFAASRGILLLASPPYTQKLNPVEGMIKILVRMALAMLRFAGAPKKLIEFALNHAVLLLNRLPRSRKGMGMVVPLELWLGIKPPSILHVLKVWGCAAYSLELGQRGKFDTKVQKMVHLGYDVARCAYVLCSLPHYKVTFSAHVTFNEADFPFKDHLRVDPSPFSLVEEQSGKEIRHTASGEAWGSYPSLERERSGNPIGLRRADAHGTLRPGLSPVRVCGQGPSDSLASPQTSSNGEAPGKRLRNGSGWSASFAGDVPESGAVPSRVRTAVASSESSSDLPGPLSGMGLARGPPGVSGGAPAAQHDGMAVAGMRRSQRSWKPSQSCLEGIAFVSREVTLAEEEMDRASAVEEGVDFQPGMPRCLPLTHKKGTTEHVFWFWESVFSVAESDFCPKKHAEAMALPLANKVREAEVNEYTSHVQNGTFGPALEPDAFAPGVALKAVWVYSHSKKEPGAFKARLVMQGFMMQQGLHYNDVHAPVPAVTSFRVFMMGVALKGRLLHHWDVKTAFLTTPMDCQIDVTLPEAFNGSKDLQPGARRGTDRHRVLKVIPGCPQGSRLWHAHLSAFLRGKGFVPVAPQEECLLVEHEKPDGIHLLVWTDDICVSASECDALRVQELLLALRAHYPNGIHEGEVRDGELSILGTVIIRQGPRKLFIHQKPFLAKLLEKAGFGAGPEKGVQIPINPSFIFTSKDCARGEDEQKGEDSKWYRSVLMSVSYLANWTRPDVAFAVSKLARFMQAPGLKHIKELKRVLRYLRCNQDLGLAMDFSREPVKHGLYGYFDASFADCVDTRRSTVAFVFFFSGATISWRTKLYTFVTTSTNHSELVASALAAREAKFLLLLVSALSLLLPAAPGPVQLLAAHGPVSADIFTDSMGVVAISRSSALSSATRHIEVADFYIRELVNRGLVTVSHVPTGEMLADALTKALSAPKFGALVACFMAKLTPSRGE